MVITDVEVFPVMLPMRQSFAISGGTVGDASQGAPHVYVKITDDSGTAGWGEGRPSHRWSYETQETVVATIERYLKPALIGQPADNLRNAHILMNRQIAAGAGSGQPIAKAAVDMALHDLFGQRTGLSLQQMWLSSGPSELGLSFLISTGDPDVAERKAREAAERGFRGLDVKIGLDKERDIDILEAVRAAAPGLFLRVDANQAYDLPQAIGLARQMERIGVDVFEQPLSASNLLGHAELRRKTNVPIGLDESIWTPGDLLQAIRLEALDWAVVKLTKMGGLLGAKLCGEIARSAGIGLLGGGLTESGLGLAASARLFLHLGIETPVDLNGPFFLAEDPLSVGPQTDGGIVRLPDGPGIGCRMDESKLSHFRVTPR